MTIELDLESMVRRIVQEELARTGGHGEWMRLATAAKEFGVSARTITRWIDAGEIRSQRNGRIVFVNTGDFTKKRPLTGESAKGQRSQG